MCMKVIIDASAFRHLIEPAPKTVGDQFRKWVLKGDGLIVHTKEAQYDRELMGSQKVVKLLEDYRQRGRVERIETDQVVQCMEQIPDRPIRRSDDPHILALAAASKATVLFSCDDKLKHDFANTAILSNVGRYKRRSVPLRREQPADIRDRSNRRQFFNNRKCNTPQ